MYMKLRLIFIYEHRPTTDSQSVGYDSQLGLLDAGLFRLARQPVNWDKFGCVHTKKFYQQFCSFDIPQNTELSTDDLAAFIVGLLVKTTLQIVTTRQL